jgi:hypothetical protein
MELRSRAMMGANALLYFGPLIAGLGGAGWGMVPVFTAVFVLWSFVVKVGETQPASVLVTQVLVQTLIIAICFGIGRGIGGVLDSMPPIPYYLPIALSFLSLPLARMGQGDVQKAEVVAHKSVDQSPDLNLAHQLLDALDQQSLSTEGDELARHLEVIGSQVNRKVILAALNARGVLSPVLERARTLLNAQSGGF